MTEPMSRHDYAGWLRAEILSLDEPPEPDLPTLEDAAETVREARRIAESLGWPDLVPLCTADALALRTARRILSKALAVVDPPASGPLTVKEAAERLGVSPKTLYSLIEARKLPCLRIGKGRGTIRIRPADLDRLGDAPQAGYRHLRL